MECQSVAKASTEKSDQSHMEGKVDEGRLISAPDETLTCNEKKTDHRPAGQLVSNAIHHTHLPPNYVRSPSDRPRLNQVLSLHKSIPLVDLKHFSRASDRPQVVQQIGRACREHGFFQIVNHGVPEIVIKQMMEVAREFFTMPVEDRMQYYSEDPSQTVRLSTSFNVQKEQVFNWRDYLRHHCYLSLSLPGHGLLYLNVVALTALSWAIFPSATSLQVPPIVASMFSPSSWCSITPSLAMCGLSPPCTSLMASPMPSHPPSKYPRGHHITSLQTPRLLSQFFPRNTNNNVKDPVK
eukprot:Gb_21102 [translate_table: standard]